MQVPVEQLVDLEKLGREGRPPTPQQIREALPPGCVLDEDGKTARRDLRVLAKEVPHDGEHVPLPERDRGGHVESSRGLCE